MPEQAYGTRVLCLETDHPMELVAMKVVADLDRLSESGESEIVRQLAGERCVGASRVLEVIRQEARRIAQEQA